jgi:hypothetical protein
MGGGMMFMECPQCRGEGKIYERAPVYEELKASVGAESIDRRSKSYREAIAKIMDVDGVDRPEAVKIFDERFSEVSV